jgi:hypothetical protein
MNAPATARLTVPRAANLARGSAVALLGLLIAVAAVLGWRRAAGAIATPLDPAGLLVAALLIAACAAGTRLAWLSAMGSALASPRRAASRADIALSALVSTVVLAIGLLVCLPGTTAAGRLLLWFALAAEELCAWRLVVRPGGHAGRVLPGASADVGRIANSSGNAADLPDGLLIRPTGKRQPTGEPQPDLSPLVSPGIPGDEVLQQLTRSRTADGGDLLSGWLRVDLAAGQRTANLHVAFCPPFARAPRVSVQQIDGPEARVKTVQTLPYGVRFDLKVADEGPEASTLLLQFAAAVSGEAASR